MSRNYGKLIRLRESMIATSSEGMPNVLRSREWRRIGRGWMTAGKDKRSSLRLIRLSLKNGRKRERLSLLILDTELKEGTPTTPVSMSKSVMWLSLSLVSMIRIWQRDKLVMIGIRASKWTMNPEMRRGSDRNTLMKLKRIEN